MIQNKKIKFFTAFTIIAGSFLVSLFSQKPTLDKSVLNGYKKCVAANQQAHAEEMKEWDKTQQSTAMEIRNASQKPVNSADDCKQSYGIAPYQDLSDFRVIN